MNKRDNESGGNRKESPGKEVEDNALTEDN